jgi:hypothetical protein
MTAIETARTGLALYDQSESTDPIAYRLAKNLRELIVEYEALTASLNPRKTIADRIAYEAAVGNRAREIVETRALFGFLGQGPITDAQVHAAYRGFCDARKGAPLADGEYEAVFSRVEFAWIRATLEAARDV